MYTHTRCMCVSFFFPTCVHEYQHYSFIPYKCCFETEEERERHKYIIDILYFYTVSILHMCSTYPQRFVIMYTSLYVFKNIGKHT